MNENKLNVLWTNADPETAELMVFMYAEGALNYGWFEKVEIIVWGATTRLVAENKNIQDKLMELTKKGVQVRFCISCARKLGLEDVIEGLGFKLEGMGAPLSDILKKDGKLLTI